jgi:hypothetical protein
LSKGTQGFVVVAHRHEQVVRVQHLVVLQVVQQRVGGDAGLAGQEHRRALDTRRRADEDRLEESFRSMASSRSASAISLRPCFQVSIR